MKLLHILQGNLRQPPCVFDEAHSGEPKPAAITLAKYINGEDYDVGSLYKFAKKQQ